MKPDSRANPHMSSPPWQLLEDAARLLGERVAGWERSAKWRTGAGPARVDASRLVMGFRVDGLELAEWTATLDAMAAPQRAVDTLAAHLPLANFGYLATEAGGAKAYLEFPVRLTRTDAQGRTRAAPPGLWALAVKWRSGESVVRDTEYWMVPGATLAGFARELREKDPAHPILGMLEVLVQRRPLASADPDAVTLYEVRHGDGARAWDLNVYGLHCIIDQGLVDAFGWPQVPTDARGARLGHVAAGRDRDGEPYRSVYWRADPRC